MSKKISDGVINGEYKLSKWVELYQKGEFNSIWAMEDAGWYDWFCTRGELLTKLNKLAPKVIEIAKSPRIDAERTYVFFKNNCPMAGPLYDSFSICDIETGDVLFWFGYINGGCYGDNREGWEVYDWREKKGQVLEYAEWEKVKRYMEI